MSGNLASRADLDTGVYSLPEAARLLGVSSQTVRRWVNGYSYQLAFGRGASGPVLVAHGSDEEWDWITFLDLIELLYIKAIRENIQLPMIREIAERIIDKTGVDHPFASGDVWQSGAALFTDLGGLELEDLGKVQLAFPFIDAYRKCLDFDGNIVTSWKPLGPDSLIVLDPRRSFGAPVDSTSGINAETLSKAYRVEGDSLTVAEWYGTSRQAVDEADKFMTRFAA